MIEIRGAQNMCGKTSWNFKQEPKKLLSFGLSLKLVKTKPSKLINYPGTSSQLKAIQLKYPIKQTHNTNRREKIKSQKESLKILVTNEISSDIHKTNK